MHCTYMCHWTSFSHAGIEPNRWLRNSKEVAALLMHEESFNSGNTSFTSERSTSHSPPEPPVYTHGYITPGGKTAFSTSINSAASNTSQESSRKDTLSTYMRHSQPHQQRVARKAMYRSDKNKMMRETSMRTGPSIHGQMSRRRSHLMFHTSMVNPTDTDDNTVTDHITSGDSTELPRKINAQSGSNSARMSSSKSAASAATSSSRLGRKRRVSIDQKRVSKPRSSRFGAWEGASDRYNMQASLEGRVHALSNSKETRQRERVHRNEKEEYTWVLEQMKKDAEENEKFFHQNASLSSILSQHSAGRSRLFRRGVIMKSLNEDSKGNGGKFGGRGGNKSARGPRQGSLQSPRLSDTRAFLSLPSARKKVQYVSIEPMLKASFKLMPVKPLSVKSVREEVVLSPSEVHNVNKYMKRLSDLGKEIV